MREKIEVRICEQNKHKDFYNLKINDQSSFYRRFISDLKSGIPVFVFRKQSLLLFDLYALKTINAQLQYRGVKIHFYVFVLKNILRPIVKIKHKKCFIKFNFLNLQQKILLSSPCISITFTASYLPVNLFIKRK